MVQLLQYYLDVNGKLLQYYLDVEGRDSTVLPGCTRELLQHCLDVGGTAFKVLKRVQLFQYLKLVDKQLFMFLRHLRC